ncbi:MAG: hypothetical protein R6T98_16100 [Desulfatiglandales bacterium]
MLKRPTREPRPPARRAYAPEGTEKKPIVFRSIGVMQRFHTEPYCVIDLRNAMKKSWSCIFLWFCLVFNTLSTSRIPYRRGVTGEG